MVLLTFYMRDWREERNEEEKRLKQMPTSSEEVVNGKAEISSSRNIR